MKRDSPTAERPPAAELGRSRFRWPSPFSRGERAKPVIWPTGPVVASGVRPRVAVRRNDGDHAAATEKQRFRIRPTSPLACIALFRAAVVGGSAIPRHGRRHSTAAGQPRQSSLEVRKRPTAVPVSLGSLGRLGFAGRRARCFRVLGAPGIRSAADVTEAMTPCRPEDLVDGNESSKRRGVRQPLNVRVPLSFVGAESGGRRRSVRGKGGQALIWPTGPAVASGVRPRVAVRRNYPNYHGKTPWNPC